MNNCHNFSVKAGSVSAVCGYLSAARAFLGSELVCSLATEQAGNGTGILCLTQGSGRALHVSRLRRV